jgi:hypothetical protein
MFIFLLSEPYRNADLLADLRRTFALHSYVKLPGLINSQAFEALKRETDYIQQFARDRNFVMEEYGSPRILTTIGGARIFTESPNLAWIYMHYEIKNLVQEIVGDFVYFSRHAHEFIVGNYLLAEGATHGWHLDDPAYALTLVFDAPTAEEGGLLEYVRDWRAFCAEGQRLHDADISPMVEQARSRSLVHSQHHGAGDAYLLRGDQCLHRVSELKSSVARRMALNLGYDAAPNTPYGSTADRLYSE